MHNIENINNEYRMFFKNDEDFNEAFKYGVSENQFKICLETLLTLLKDTTNNFSINVDNEFFTLDNTDKLVKLAVIPTGDYVMYTYNKKVDKYQSYKRFAYLISLYIELVKIGVLENDSEKHLKFVSDHGYDTHETNRFKKQVDSLMKLAKK